MYEGLDYRFSQRGKNCALAKDADGIHVGQAKTLVSCSSKTWPTTLQARDGPTAFIPLVEPSEDEKGARLAG